MTNETNKTNFRATNHESHCEKEIDEFIILCGVFLWLPINLK